MHFIRWLGGAERRAGFLFAQFTGGAGRRPSYGVIAEGWPQPRRADGSRTCARSEISAVHFIRWLGGAERRAGFLFAQFTGGAGRRPSYGVIAEGWPQPRRADGSRTCARSEISAVHFIRWLGGAERRAGFLFAQFTGGAGRRPSYGVIAEGWPQPRRADGSRTCARSEISAVHFIRWLGGAERRAGFLFAQFTGGAGRRPSYGVIAEGWPQPRRADGSRTCARSEISAVHFIRWLGGAERRAGFLFAQFTGGAGRRPSYGVIAEGWPQPRRADGSRTCARSEISAVHFIRWLGGAERRAGFLFAQFTGGAGRRPSYGVIAEGWPQPRRADGSRTCARSEISAVHFIRWLGGAERRAGFLFAQFTGGAGRRPSYGVIAEGWPQPRRADGSRTCARSEISAVHFIRWLGGAERRAGFLFAQFTGGAGRRPSYGVIAEGWPQPRRADGSRTCARSEISAVHFIRWLGGAERRAGFLFAQFTGGAGRRPSYGVIAEGWPQPRRADGSRTCARSEISAVHFIRWLGGAERRAGLRQ